MQDISEAIVAGSQQAVAEHRETQDEAERRRVKAGEGNRAEPQPAAWQFQDRDGKWHGFMNEQHRQNTIADGSWPIRALYAAPPSTPVGVEGVSYKKARELLANAYSDAGCFSVADKLLRTGYVSNANEVVALRAIEMALAQQPASSAPDPAAGDAVAMQPVAEVAMSDDGYKIGLLGPLRAHRLPLGTKLYASPRAAIYGANAPVGVEDWLIGDLMEAEEGGHTEHTPAELCGLAAKALKSLIAQHPAAVDGEEGK